MDIEITVTDFDDLIQCAVKDSDIVISFMPDPRHPEWGGRVCYGPLSRRYHWLIDGRLGYELFEMISHEVQIACGRKFIEHLKNDKEKWERIMHGGPK